MNFLINIKFLILGISFIVDEKSYEFLFFILMLIVEIVVKFRKDGYRVIIVFLGVIGVGFWRMDVEKRLKYFFKL